MPEATTTSPTEEQDPLRATRPQQPRAASYDAASIDLNANEDTVEGRLAGIIEKNAPLQQIAATRANEQMNRRGLVNSSMAIGAGQKAVIESALPIAQQDAATSFGARTANTAATNRAREFGAGNEQQLTAQGFQGDLQSYLTAQQGIISSRLAEQEGGIRSRLQAEQGQIQMALQTADAATRERLLARQGEIEAELLGLRAQEERTTLAQQQAGERSLTELRGQIERGLQELRGGQAEELARIDNEYRVLLQSSQSATALYSQISESMATILAADIPIAQKQQLISHQTTLLNSGLRLIGGMGNLDLTALLGSNPGNISGGPTAPPRRTESDLRDMAGRILGAFS